MRRVSGKHVAGYATTAGPVLVCSYKLLAFDERFLRPRTQRRVLTHRTPHSSAHPSTCSTLLSRGLPKVLALAPLANRTPRVPPRLWQIHPPARTLLRRPLRTMPRLIFYPRKSSPTLPLLQQRTNQRLLCRHPQIAAFFLWRQMKQNLHRNIHAVQRKPMVALFASLNLFILQYSHCFSP